MIHHRVRNPRGSLPKPGLHVPIETPNELAANRWARPRDRG